MVAKSTCVHLTVTRTNFCLCMSSSFVFNNSAKNQRLGIHTLLSHDSTEVYAEKRPCHYYSDQSRLQLGYGITRMQYTVLHADGPLCRDQECRGCLYNGKMLDGMGDPPSSTYETVTHRGLFILSAITWYTDHSSILEMTAVMSPNRLVSTFH